MVMNQTRLRRSRLSAAMFAALLMPTAGMALAQAQENAGAQDTSQQEATNLDKVTVTGSLIPITEIETATPITVITAEDIRARGFTSVADVLQQTSFSTGGVQGQQVSASFTQGAETLSLFGLPPGYTKFLIDGRPMANYPALYNGSDTFNNISGIPVDLVERIEILPGGQSSLYGSDAIAGVINIILKKSMDGGVLAVRGGAYSEGGGSSFRVSAADSFESADGRFNGLAGVQYETVDPIWGYQRDITSQFYTEGSSPQLASRDFLVVSPFTSYKFLDPANCANVSHLFDGSIDLQTRPGFGDENYCGSTETPGYRTIKNGKESAQLYTHATFDLSDNAQLYGDLLYNHETVDYHVGSNFTWWGTSLTWGYYYDPTLDDFVNLQRSFAPEEMGPEGFNSTMSHDKSEAYTATFGIKGTFGSSNWDYDAFGMRTEYKLTSRSFARFTDPIDSFFQDKVLGPQLGLDPYYGIYPVFQPDYAEFYKPITPEEFASFTGYLNTQSKTTDTMARGQVTNASLFTLPGGDAGIAIAAEGGKETWRYTPDPRLLDGSVWGQTDVQGGGDRTRYAVTAEMRLPLLDMLTASVSGRYDSFDVEGNTIDSPTYSVSLEFRPIDSLLFRGKYGTAFRAPTLSDLFQGESGYFSFVTDYYSCQQLGFDPANVDDCPAQLSNRQFFGTQSGSTELQPIEADVWNAGVVWAPTANFSFSVDYFDWDIRDEVNTQSANNLALQEMFCRTGQQDINSPSCQDALSKITRNAQGFITEIFTPKINVSQQRLRAITANLNYLWDIGTYGSLNFTGSYTSNLEHTQQIFPGDPEIDLLREPFYSSDPKTKANASVTWNIDKWAVTGYVNRMGKTPNYLSQIANSYSEGTIGPWILYNLGVNYEALDSLEFSFLVNNVFNKIPEDHSRLGTSGAPYDNFQYNPYGRALYVEMRYKFGASE